MGSPSNGRPCGTLPQQRDALGLEAQEWRREQAGKHHQKRHGPVLEPELAGDEHRQGNPSHHERCPVRLTHVCKEVRGQLPEIPVRTLEAEQLRHLRAGQVERQPCLEAHEHGFGEEADGIPGADQPCGNRDDCHQQRGTRGERRMASGVTAAQLADRRDRQQRQRRRDGHDGVLRAAEEPEDQSRKEARVETRLGWKSRQRGVANSRREEVRGKREAGHEVWPQPLAPVVGQPLKNGDPQCRDTCLCHSATSHTESVADGRNCGWLQILRHLLRRGVRGASHRRERPVAAKALKASDIREDLRHDGVDGLSAFGRRPETPSKSANFATCPPAAVAGPWYAPCYAEPTANDCLLA